jgi:hypothetical protein
MQTYEIRPRKVRCPSQRLEESGAPHQRPPHFSSIQAGRAQTFRMASQRPSTQSSKNFFPKHPPNAVGVAWRKLLNELGVEFQAVEHDARGLHAKSPGDNPR